MREMGDKVDEKTRQDIDSQIEKVKRAMEGEDRDAIQREVDQLMQISHKIAEEAYKRASEQQAGAEGTPHEEAAGARKKPDDDVVDADFEEVKDK